MTTSNELLLSDILKSTPKFSFLQELINIRQLEQTSSETLLKYDFFKINKTINDVIVYLTELMDVFHEISHSNLNQELNWIFEGKLEILEILKNIESIDSIISQLLIIVDIKTNKDEITSSNYMELLNEFERISELSLDVKKYVLLYKKKLDVSVQFNELDTQVIDSINNEIDSCLKQSFKIYEIKLSTPSRMLPNFNLEQILAKMKFNDSKKISLRSIKLPTFNNLDEILYQNYLELESRVTPLDASINFIPLRLEEYKHIAKDYYPGSIEIITGKFNSLTEKWKFLNRELKQIKAESLDQRWNEIFRYLITEINFQINDLLKVLRTDNGILSHENTPKYKLARNVLGLIEKGFNENIIKDMNLKELNNELVSKFSELNSIIKVNESIDSQNNETSNSISVSKIRSNSNESLTNINNSNNSIENSNLEFGLKKLHISPSSESPKTQRNSFDIQLFTQFNKSMDTPTKLSKKQLTGKNFLRRLSIQPILVETTPVSIEKSKNYSTDNSELINAPTINSNLNKNINEKLFEELNKDDNEFNFNNHSITDNSTPINRVNRLSDSIIHEDEILTDFSEHNDMNSSTTKAKNLTITVPNNNNFTSPQSKRSSTHSNHSSNKSSPKVSRSKLPILLSPMTPKHISKFNLPSRRSSMIPVLNSNYAKSIQSPVSIPRRSSVNTVRLYRSRPSSSEDEIQPLRQTNRKDSDGFIKPNKRASMLVQPTTRIETRTRPHSALNNIKLFNNDPNSRSSSRSSSRSNSSLTSRYDQVNMMQPLSSPRPTWR